MNHHQQNLVEKITGAIFFIFLGIVLLLNTTGVVGWNVWVTFFLTLLRLWPLLLISLGLNIIFSSSPVIKAVLSILSTLLSISIMCIAILANLNYITLPSNFQDVFQSFNISIGSKDQKTSSNEIKKTDYPQIKNINYTFKMSSGEINISNDNQGETYLELFSNYYKDYGVPKINSTLENNILNVDFTQEFQNTLGFFKGPLQYNFALDNQNLITSYKFNLTAGELNASLFDKKISDLTLDMTAGNAKIDLNEISSLGVLDVNITAGSATINIPKEFNLKLKVKSTAGSVSLDGSNIENGEKLVSGSSEDTILINITQTAGSLSINRD